MRAHIERWQSLTLSPADRAILDQMEEEMDDEMVTLPAEPTEAMVKAGMAAAEYGYELVEAYEEGGIYRPEDGLAREIYIAMLNAFLTPEPKSAVT